MTECGSIEFSSNTFVPEFTSFGTELFPEHATLKGSVNSVGKTLSLELVLKTLLFKECFELPKMLSYFQKTSQFRGKRDAIFLIIGQNGTSEAQQIVLPSWDRINFVTADRYPVDRSQRLSSNNKGFVTASDNLLQSSLSLPLEKMSYYLT